MKKSVLAKLGALLQAGLLLGTMLAVLPVSTYAASTPTANWKPDSNGVFCISSAADLLAFARDAEANDWYNGKAVKLLSDVDMSGQTWTPVQRFRGFFEGNGKTIKNLTLKSSTPRIAMFDTLDGATIRNLHLEATLTQTGSGGMAALLAVETAGKPVTIENVYVGGSLSTPKVSTNFRNGGFIAHVMNQTTIQGCASNVSILKGYKANGGFVGANAFTSQLTMTDCVYYGSLSSSLDVETTGFVGRVVGNVTLTRCLNLSYTRSSTNQYQGAFLYLDNKDFALGGDSSALAVLYPMYVVLEDCYTTLVKPGDVIVGAHTSRFIYTVTVKYEGLTRYQSSENKADYKTVSALMRTVAEGANVELNKNTFREVCPGFSNWVVTDKTVQYATVSGSKMYIPVVLPRDINQLLAGTYLADGIPALTPYEDETTSVEEDTTTTGEETSRTPEEEETTFVGSNETASETTGSTDNGGTGCDATVGGAVGAIVATAGVAMLKARKKEEKEASAE